MSKNVIGTTRTQRKIEIPNSAMILTLIIWDTRGAFYNERKRRFHVIGITGFTLLLFGAIFNASTSIRKRLCRILLCSSTTVRRMCLTILIKILNVFVKYLQLIRPGAELSSNQLTFVLFFLIGFFACLCPPMCFYVRDYKTDSFKLQLHLVGREKKHYQ